MDEVGAKSSEGYDLGLQIDLRKGPLKTINVKPMTRVDSHLKAWSGSLEVKEAGTLILTMDNSYSYFRTKNGYYKFSIVSSVKGTDEAPTAESTAVQVGTTEGEPGSEE